MTQQTDSSTTADLQKIMKAIKDYVRSLNTPDNIVYKENELLIQSCFSKAMEIVEQVFDGEGLTRNSEADWISVEDRLPEKWEYVLIYDAGCNSISIENMVKVKEDGTPVFDSPDSFRGSDTVTHWMPLPNPPKGEYIIKER